jgi:hypothetical protein
MKQWVLIRLNEDSKYTHGILLDPDGSRFCYTLEPPWKSNRPEISSIPEGIYKCSPVVHYTKSGQSYPAYQIERVKDRRDIHIHKGNFPKDTSGCVLLGDGIGPGVVYDSKPAFDRFMNMTNGEEFGLLITDGSYFSEQIKNQIDVPAKLKYDFKKDVITKLERAADQEDGVSILDKIVHYTPIGFKRIAGIVSTVTGIVTGKYNENLSHILIALGIIAVIIGILHAMARKSLKYNKQGEFWVSDLAKWLLDTLTKRK